MAQGSVPRVPAVVITTFQALYRRVRWLERDTDEYFGFATDSQRDPTSSGHWQPNMFTDYANRIWAESKGDGRTASPVRAMLSVLSTLDEPNVQYDGRWIYKEKHQTMVDSLKALGETQRTQ